MITKCHWSLASLFTQNTLYWAIGGYRTCNICSEKVCFWYFQFSRKDYFVCSRTSLASFFSGSNGLCLAATDVKYCEANCSRRGGFYVKWGFHLSCSFLFLLHYKKEQFLPALWIRQYLLTDPDPRIRNPEFWNRIREAEILLDIPVVIYKLDFKYQSLNFKKYVTFSLFY